MGAWPLLVLLAGALPLQSPTPPDRSAGLVELTSLDSSIRLDIRYATTNNIMGRAVYPEPRAYLQRNVAEALVRVHHALEEQGLGVLVLDGYRPWSVTRLFWDSSSPAQRRFLADPARGSNHNRGCAVDLSLFERASGHAVEMPSGYDEMSPRAAPGYTGGSPEARSRRDLLRAAMERGGFAVDGREWWHFNHQDCRRYPVLDIPFAALHPTP
jgi:D-alanyl-D-alanine dipeptidase